MLVFAYADIIFLLYISVKSAPCISIRVDLCCCKTDVMNYTVTQR